MSRFLSLATKLCGRAAILGVALGASGSALAANASVKQVRGPIWVTVPTAASPLQSIAVKAPGNGNLIVTVTGTANYEHTLGSQGYYCLQLANVSAYVGGCTPNAGSDSAVRASVAAGFPTTTPNMGASEQYSIVRTWPVTAGTTYTFYLNGSESGFDAMWLFQPSITAVYVPGTMP